MYISLVLPPPSPSYEPSISWRPPPPHHLLPCWCPLVSCLTHLQPSHLHMQFAIQYMRYVWGTTAWTRENCNCQHRTLIYVTVRKRREKSALGKESAWEYFVGEAPALANAQLKESNQNVRGLLDSTMLPSLHLFDQCFLLGLPGSDWA